MVFGFSCAAGCIGCEEPECDATVNGFRGIPEASATMAFVTTVWGSDELLKACVTVATLAADDSLESAA